MANLISNFTKAADIHDIFVVLYSIHRNIIIIINFLH